MKDLAELKHLVICPSCGCGLSDDLKDTGVEWRCISDNCDLASAPFPVVHGQPVLVDFRSSVLDREKTLAAGATSLVERDFRGWRAWVSRTINGQNKIAPKAAEFLIKQITSPREVPSGRPTLLVVGGGTVGSGAQALYQSQQINLVSFDIYRTPMTDFIADAHSIPLADQSMDAVWIQAVLEHVLDPVRVVSEIERVLKPDGLVFVDTPFMWPVHEKAYDFTRWTPTGHRWLFRNFEVISAGSSAGIGTACVLAIRYLAGALLRSWTLGDLVALPFFWLRYIDHLASPTRVLESPAGIFFLGRKSAIELEFAALREFYQDQERYLKLTL